MESAGLRRRQREQKQPPEPPLPRTNTQNKRAAPPSNPSTHHNSDNTPLPRSLTTGYTPPLFTIDLSQPPHHRYDHVAHAFQPALASINFESLFTEAASLLLPPAITTGPAAWLLPPTTHLLRILSRLLLRRLHSAEETAELRGIARETGLALDLLVAFNVGLDLLMGCTSGGVRMQGDSSSSSASGGSESKIVHFRTLDWDMDSLRALVVELEFVKFPGGPVVARTVGYFGYVGVLTGVRRGLSLGLNFRAGSQEEAGGGWGKRWKLGWHLGMVLMGWRRGVASVLREYLLGDGAARKKKTGTGYVELDGGDGELPGIDDILEDLAHSPSTAAYLIFCTPSRVYSVEKGYRTASVRSSGQFLATCNHDVADEPDPGRIHAAAQNVASRGMAEIIDESFERKQAVEEVWKQRVRLRRKSRPRGGEGVDAVNLDDVLQMLGHEYITYGGTHFAVVMDPEHGEMLWRRVYRTDDLRE